jgi:hypothetical protein
VFEAAIPVAENTSHDHHRNIVRRVPADTFDCDDDVGGAAVVVTNMDFGTDKTGLGVESATKRDGSRRDREKCFLASETSSLCSTPPVPTNHAVGGVVRLDIGG